jgi:hypothetical protein
LISLLTIGSDEKMFEDAINENAIATLTNEELDQLIAMLEKAGY